MRTAADSTTDDATDGPGPGRRAASWALGIAVALVVASVVFLLIPANDESSVENSPLSVTRDEKLVMVGTVGVLAATLYVVLYVVFWLRRNARG